MARPRTPGGIHGSELSRSARPDEHEQSHERGSRHSEMVEAAERALDKQ